MPLLTEAKPISSFYPFSYQAKIFIRIFPCVSVAKIWGFYRLFLCPKGRAGFLLAGDAAKRKRNISVLSAHSVRDCLCPPAPACHRQVFAVTSSFSLASNLQPPTSFLRAINYELIPFLLPQHCNTSALTHSSLSATSYELSPLRDPPHHDMMQGTRAIQSS